MRLPPGATLARSTLYALLEAVRLHETIYKQAGAVHGCALATNEPGRSEILAFVEDVGRHNAVDAIAGQMWLDRIDGADKIFYTTGRLTSEMVIKAAQMGIPFLVSRSGLTQMGYEIAEKVGMTMIGRATNKHFLLFTGGHRFRSEPLIPPADVTGIVLAGGQGRRMGGVDKGLVELDGRPMVGARARAPRPQVGEVLINANQNLDRYRALGYPVVPDEVGGFAGPLAGLHAGLTRADATVRRHRALRFAVPARGPRGAPRRGARTRPARSSPWRRRSTSRIRCSPSCAATCSPGLAAFLEGGGRKIDAWYAALEVVEVRFDDEADAFRNINTADELSAAAQPEALESLGIDSPVGIPMNEPQDPARSLLRGRLRSELDAGRARARA